MLFLGYPVEIWIATALAILIKLKSSPFLTLFGALTTVLVGIGAGVLGYRTAVTLLELSTDWNIVVAVLLALTAENIAKTVIEFSADTSMLKEFASWFINRDKKGQK